MILYTVLLVVELWLMIRAIQHGPSDTSVFDAPVDEAETMEPIAPPHRSMRSRPSKEQRNGRHSSRLRNAAPRCGGGCSASC